MKLINVCVIKPIATDFPLCFDDSAQAFLDSLRALGYSSAISYNKIDPTALNVVFGLGSHGTVSIEQFRAVAAPSNTVVFNMEQLASNSALLTDSYWSVLSEYPVFDYNKANVEFLLHRFPLARSFEVPLAPTSNFPSLGLPPKDVTFDFAFYGASHPRREHVLSRLGALGCRIKRVSGAYGEHLSHAISDCRAVLNIHCYDSAIFETARVLRPVADGIPVFSEASVMPDLLDWSRSGVMFFEENFVENAFLAINNIDLLLTLNRKNVSFLKEKPWLVNLKPIVDGLIHV